MPNDAKLGLVIGVGLIIALGLMHSRNEVAAPAPASGNKVTAVKPATGRGQYRTVRGRVSRNTAAESTPASSEPAP
jgi:hypothetical protein